MKQIVCEMCGSTQMLKQDGVFICQGCGTKYSVEEAKKMMVEVEGEPVMAAPMAAPVAAPVSNTAQIENFLNLAQSSFDSKNYAQAEEFCNQVIALDTKNYDAWKLKGEAINYQITSKNQRILEVFNCIMTSYRVLDEEGKSDKAAEILISIKTCLEGEVTFWLDQFEAGRPTSAALTRAKNAYVDSYNKMKAAFEELGLAAVWENGYDKTFDNLFITKANQICVSAWKTTVGYNYYRDDFDSLGSGWGTGTTWSNIVTRNTDAYRPMKKTFTTFVEETDNLISLLEYAITQFNDETEDETKINVYENIVYFHRRLNEGHYYKIDHDSTGIGWAVDGSLSDSARSLRRTTIERYEKKVENIKKEQKRKIIDGVKESCASDDEDKIYTDAVRNLDSKKYVEAQARFDILKASERYAVFAYIGLAIKEYLEDVNESAALRLIAEASKHKCADADSAKLVNLVNKKLGSSKMTLICIAAGNYNFQMVKYLVDIGAEVNGRTGNNNTALWFVAHKALPAGKEELGRGIANFLLSKGAEINVTNSGGVALFNNKTDSEIARMIKAKYPDATTGAAPAAPKRGGCYVATAVYGSYDCPEVWTLRRYRDDILAKSWYGRAFIRTYYAISPTLVKWFGDTEWFKKMWQGKLDRMVADLREQGVESTPYEDKNW